MSSEDQKIKLSSRILKALSFFLLFISIIIVIFSTATNQIDYNLLMLGFGFLFLSAILGSIAGEGIIKIKYETLTELRCTNKDCKFLQYNKFNFGDYVFKILKKCDLCKKGDIFIQNIFHIKETEAKKLMEQATTGASI